MANVFILEGGCGDRRDRIGHESQWRWIWILATGVVAVAPLALSAFYDLPPVVFAVSPMVLYVAVWRFFRQLDAPPAPKQPRPPRRDDPPRDRPPRPRTPGSPRSRRRARIAVAKHQVVSVVTEQ